MGEVGLPAFVGLVGFEPPVGALRPLLRFGCDQPGCHQDPTDRGGRRHWEMLLFKVPADRLRPVIEALTGELAA